MYTFDVEQCPVNVSENLTGTKKQPARIINYIRKAAAAADADG